MEQPLKPCAYYVVRYVPRADREEFLNIGLFLLSAEDQFLDCLFTRDFRRVKRFHPQADLEFLRQLQSHFEQQIQEHEDNLPAYLDEMLHSFSHAIQLAPPCAVLAADPAAELSRLFPRLVGQPQAQLSSPGTRMRIKHRLVEALRQAKVFDYKAFERRIPAAPLTHAGDPFHFDFGYRPRLTGGKPNGHLKLLHALSLHRDHELAKILSLTIGYVRKKQPAELTAIVEGWPAHSDKTAGHSYQILKDARVTVRPLAEVAAFAASVRDELALSFSAAT